MYAETILYIIIAAIIAFALALFMYGYKSKYSSKLNWLFGTLRFISLFSILLLLINPKFTKNSYTTIKPKLSVLMDNSSSIKELNQTESVNYSLKQFKENSSLSKKFDISYFSFGSDINQNDLISFSEKNTNISKALSTVNEVTENEIAPIILLSDGNQTVGNDYEFSASSLKNKVFPIILGDSIEYTDLKIEQVNSNRYAFLKNQFPVEVIITYSGNENVTSQYQITQGNAVLHKENVTFSPTNNSKTIGVLLTANSVGLQKYTAQIVPLSDEKNKVNNNKQFAVEVIDQATNILLVSNIEHPDLGAIKKAVSSNEQRSISIKKPSEAEAVLNDFQLIILYQPDSSFQKLYAEISTLNKNTLVISGLNTDWNFLNKAQKIFNKEENTQTDEVQGELNSNFGPFAVEDIGFADFRPLKTFFGSLQVTVPHEILLKQTINSIASGDALIATAEINGTRHAIWDGEGIWKWRAQSFINSNDYKQFDDFFGQIIQYLASNKRRSRLEVSNETFYYNNLDIKVSAQYFDENFAFNPNASLEINVSNKETEAKTVFPMLLKNNYYEVDLNTLAAGEYSFTVSVKGEEISRSGSFTILDYNVEQQFLNANVSKLQRLASNTNAKAYFVNQTDILIKDLLADETFKSIQKNEVKTVPLVDWKYLLTIIVLALSAEWFIRKYNGLI